MGLIGKLLAYTLLAGVKVMVEAPTAIMEGIIVGDKDEKVTLVDPDTGEEHEVRKCDLDR